ncbi:hypothetical protein PCL_00298 [Purpureocillium lilacinum]|uniref:Uncharacterized protein n=1 Tax=Purpureocillium lilacinum TaxID=33203 RepID=A0A2U3E6Q5_PURLI|nr:hypothetical protein PCL_00298 [Purpureocillium lilacinum]
MASAVRSEPRRIDAGANGRDDEQGIDLTPSLGAVGQGQRALQSCPNASIHQHTTDRFRRCGLFPSQQQHSYLSSDAIRFDHDDELGPGLSPPIGAPAAPRVDQVPRCVHAARPRCAPPASLSARVVVTPLPPPVVLAVSDPELLLLPRQAGRQAGRRAVLSTKAPPPPVRRSTPSPPRRRVPGPPGESQEAAQGCLCLTVGPGGCTLDPPRAPDLAGLSPFLLSFFLSLPCSLNYCPSGQTPGPLPLFVKCLCLPPWTTQHQRYEKLASLPALRRKPASVASPAKAKGPETDSGGDWSPPIHPVCASRRDVMPRRHSPSSTSISSALAEKVRMSSPCDACIAPQPSPATYPPAPVQGPVVSSTHQLQAN